MQFICNNLFYTTKNKELQMFLELHKRLAIKPSNNLSYIGGLENIKVRKIEQQSSSLYKIEVINLKLKKEQ